MCVCVIRVIKSWSRLVSVMLVLTEEWVDLVADADYADYACVCLDGRGKRDSSIAQGKARLKVGLSWRGSQLVVVDCDGD